VTDPDKVRQYGELIHQQSRRLNETVEQTLQFAGIHSGLRRPQKNPIALRPILEEVVEARREEMQRQGVELDLAIDDDLPEAAIDAALVRTAIDNLLSNALKHAESGRWIRLSAGRAPNADEVRISVEDRGPGIDPNDKEEIFKPFWRGRAAMDEQVPGSGIGLSLVRSAAEAHGGAVTVESEPGRGSVFTLHLPL
jgi:signal transduction histidine kinase